MRLKFKNVAIAFDHELHGCRLVSSSLHEQIENLAFIVDRAPKLGLLAANHHSHLIEMPLGGRPMALVAKLSGE